MIKFKDSECYPIKFDLLGLIAISDKLVFPMVWHEKFYLKKVIRIDKNSILILGRKLEEGNWTLAPEDQAFILTIHKINKLIGSKVNNGDFSSCQAEIAKIIGSKLEEDDD